MTVNLKALIGKLNQTTRTVLESAAGLCLSRTNYDIEVEHFLLKLLDSKGSDFELIANRFGVDRSCLTGELTRSLDHLKSGNARTPAFSPSVVDALAKGWLYGSIEHDATKVRTGFVVLALLADDELSKLMGEISREIQKIDAQALQRDFAAVVRGSEEDQQMAVPAEVPTRSELTGGPRIFISYRRDDSTFYADFLFDRLRAEVPDVRVFRDSDTLKPGMVYTDKIDETVAACDILLAIIGKKWVGATDQSGRRRIDLVDDWVRLEVTAALKHNKLVIPCLVGGARIPNPEELPPDLAGLAVRQAVNISQKYRRQDAEGLVQQLINWRRFR